MTEHPDLLLSAYLDDALPSDERATVGAHVDACPRCQARLDDLRATARLIGALPVLGPTRSLLPRVRRGPVWLRPVRLLGSMGSGVFLFLFLASAILNSGSSLGGGTTESERLAAKGQFGPAASALAAENAQRAVGAPTSAAAPAPAAQGTANQDSTRSAATATGGAQQFAAATGAATSVSTIASPRFGPSPALFLGLALLCSIVAFVAHRRLRRS